MGDEWKGKHHEHMLGEECASRGIDASLPFVYIRFPTPCFSIVFPVPRTSTLIERKPCKAVYNATTIAFPTRTFSYASGLVVLVVG